jgi:hypothetical protein
MNAAWSAPAKVEFFAPIMPTRKATPRPTRKAAETCAVPARVSLNGWRDLIQSKHGPEKSSDRNVLQVIAKYMRADGVRAFPSQETIVKHTRLSLRQVRDSIQRAEREAWVMRDKGRRENGQNWYMTYYTATVPEPLLAVLAQWEQEKAAKKGPAEFAAPSGEGPAKGDRRTGKYRHKDRQNLPTISLSNSHKKEERQKDACREEPHQGADTQTAPTGVEADPTGWRSTPLRRDAARGQGLVAIHAYLPAERPPEVSRGKEQRGNPL